MRPYLAVIKDSFRAAMASWVLYIMFILITLFLLVLVPVGIKEQLTSELRPFEVVDPGGLAERITRLGQQNSPSPERQIWTHLDSSLQARLVELQKPLSLEDTDDDEALATRIREVQSTVSDLIGEIRGMLPDEDFYDEQAWKDVKVDEETQELLDKKVANLSHEQLGRLNRLLFDAAFSQYVSKSTQTSLRLMYFIWEYPEAVPVRKEAFAKLVHQYLPWYLDKLVLSIGVFVAILVTAPIIPQTFEPGSLHLLLSKPISRSGLFLSKFTGGCAFILLCAIYMFTGLWLIFGLRLGIWHVGILLCIPIYIFVFAIYYTISAIASLVWRNTVVSIVIAIVFWLVCFGTGATKDRFEATFNQFRLAKIMEADDSLIAIDEENVPYVWNDGTRKWDKTFLTEEYMQWSSVAYVMPMPSTPEMAGPVYDERRGQLLAAQDSRQLAAHSRQRNQMMFGGGQAILVGQKKDDWRPVEAVPAPLLTIALLKEVDGNIVAVSRLGTIYRLTDDPLKLLEQLEELGRKDQEKKKGRAASAKENVSAKPAPDASDEKTKPSTGENGATEKDRPPAAEVSNGDDQPAAKDANVADEEAHDSGSKLDLDFDPFVEVGPNPPLTINFPSAVAMNADSGEIAVYNRATITILAKNAEGRYERKKNGPDQDGTKKLEGDEALAVGMVFGGDTLLICRGDGDVLALDAATLTVRQTYRPEPKSRARFVSVAPQGRWFAVSFHNGKLWLLDREQDEQMIHARVTGQGDISGVSFTGTNRMLVCDRTTRVSEYILGDNIKLDRRFSPRMSVFETVYRYGVYPLYVLCPKPGEFHYLVTYLLTEDETTGSEFADASAAQTQLHPWAPFWNGLIFMVVMLGCACLYFERQEF